MNELMRDEILDQPEAIRMTLPSVRHQLPNLLSDAMGLKRIIFTGSGDSYFAPLALECAARQHLSMDVHVFPSQMAARYWSFSSGDFLVAISISGEAGRTVEAAQAARKSKAFVLAVTANESSTLAKLSSAALVIPFRSRSRKTPHTTDYLTTLLAISAVIEALGGHHFAVLNDLSNVVSHSLQALEKPCFEIGQTLKQAEYFYFLGTGPSFGTAQYAAAKFWEVGGLKAFPFELEEFGHGPHMLVASGDPVFIIAPNGRSTDRALLAIESLKTIGAASFVITDNPELLNDAQILHAPALTEEWSPFGTGLSMQWLCWAVATVKGYDVVTKNSLGKNAEWYERAHRQLVRSTSSA
jgi:glucosamine--fructose-6-phosphate aminotransferase (isomerizing)